MTINKNILVKSSFVALSVVLVSTVSFQIYKVKIKDKELAHALKIQEEQQKLMADIIKPVSEGMVAQQDNSTAKAIKVSQERQITHRVSKGETLQVILRGLGMDATQVAKALKELQKVYNTKLFNVGQELQIHYMTEAQNQSARLLSLSFKTSGAHIIALKHQEGSFQANKKAVQLTKIIHRVEGNINSSFYSAALKKGVPASIVKQAISALSYEVNWQHDPKHQDPYCIVYEAFVDDQGKMIQSGELKYAGFAPGGASWRQIYAFKTKAGTGYYNGKGESVIRSLLQTPVDPTKMRITSKFGSRRHPIHGYTKQHKGVDFGAPMGSPVSSAGDGVVVKAGWNGGYGNYVLIRHNGEYSTAYAHLSKINVKVGQVIKQRQVIGKVGSTGSSTGPHLHYEVIYRGQQVNPQKIKQLPTHKLTRQEMAQFVHVKSTMDKGSFMLTKGSANKIETADATASKKLQVAMASKPPMVG